MNCPLRSCHSISIGFKSGLGHSRTFILFLLSHSEVDLLVCFGSLSCCITQLRLSFRSRTDGWTFSFRIFWERAEFMVPSIMASRPGPEAAKQPQTITLPPPCLTVGMMFLLWNAVLALRQMERDPCLSKSSTFDSSVHRILSQKSWGVIKMFFFGKCEMSLCVLFGHQWFLPCNSPMDAISAQSLSNLES